MKKIIIALFLMLASNAVMAEWVLYSVSSYTSLSAYYDPDSVKVRGHMVKVWIIYDFTKPEGDAYAGERYSSIKNQVEIDCYDERNRLTYISHYSGRMGFGKVMSSYNIPNGEFSPTVPDTVMSSLSDIVCK
jgi:hypothetical protein